MKQKLVQTLEQSGNNYGQVSSPLDLVKAQEFAHNRLSDAIRDFVINGSTREVKGFEFTQTGDMQLRIGLPGCVYTANGISYELGGDNTSRTLTFAAAHETLTRIDVVIAKLEDEVLAETDLIPFIRLRTPEQFAANVSPYAPTNLSAATEKHWRVVVQIKTGTAAATPAVPTLASNEVPLFQVTVRAAATRVERSTDIIDLRNIGRSLRSLDGAVHDLRVDHTALESRTYNLEHSVDLPVDLSQIFGQISTLGELFALFQSQIAPSADLPDVRYERLKTGVTMADNASSKIVCAGGSSGGVPYLDIEVGGRVNFGVSEHAILPQKFLDQTVTPRFATIGSPTGHVQRNVDTTIISVTPGETDGSLNFIEKSAMLPAWRMFTASAARDSRYIELFGGQATNSYGSALGDWKTYDTENDVFSNRTLSGTVPPSSDRPVLIPYGDGVNMLLLTYSIANDGAWTRAAPVRCFKVNTSTWVSTELTGVRPAGVGFMGDLIHAGKILILADDDTVVTTVKAWEFDTATDTFTPLTMTGTLPPTIGAVNQTGSGCMLSDNKFVLLATNRTNGNYGDLFTYVFDRTTLQWSKLNITRPSWSNSETDNAYGATGFRLANVSGRPVVLGGYPTGFATVGPHRAFELTGPTNSGGLLSELRWNTISQNFGGYGHSFASMITTDGLPNGKGVTIGGAAGGVSRLRAHISFQAGLITGSHNSVAGVTVAEGSTFAKFTIPLFTAAWAVASYRVSLIGNLPPGSFGLEYSMNGGANWYPMAPDTTVTVQNSATPGGRLLRVTLYRTPTSPPVLTRIVETLDENGGVIEDLQVVRFNTPTSGAARALYLKSNGDIEISTTIEPSTPQKAIICKLTPNTTSAPTVKNYINRRRPLIRYTGTRASGTTTPFSNELAVPVRHINAFVKKAADASMYKIDEPAIAFDASAITPAGLGANGDIYYIDIAG